MATRGTYHGIIGIQNGTHYNLDNKSFWRYVPQSEGRSAASEILNSLILLTTLEKTHPEIVNELAKTTSIDRAVEFLFPQALLTDLDACLQRVFLSPQNMFVDEFNDKILEKLPGEYSE